MILGYVVSAIVQGGLSVLLMVGYCLQIYWHWNNPAAQRHSPHRPGAGAAAGAGGPGGGQVAVTRVNTAASAVLSVAGVLAPAGAAAEAAKRKTAAETLAAGYARTRHFFHRFGVWCCLAQILLVVDHEGGNGLLPLVWCSVLVCM